LEKSILNPPAGQNQRFCYTVEGVGSDSSDFANLSHLVFSICNQIQESQIVNITVDDVTYNFDDLVVLFIPPNTDPPTGCPGLKFNFGLDKVGGVMEICFELTTPFAIGPVPVCLFGGNTAVGGLSICGPICGEVITCTKTAEQSATICVPVTVAPFVRTGLVTTVCCGDPVITPGHTCPETTNRTCEYKVRQKICVSIPFEFAANTRIPNFNVQCSPISEGCTDCNQNGG
jgi:hypothetical protein